MKRPRDNSCALADWGPATFGFANLCARFPDSESAIRDLLVVSATEPLFQSCEASAPAPSHSPREQTEAAPKNAKPVSALSKLLAMAKNKKSSASYPLQTTTSVREVKPLQIVETEPVGNDETKAIPPTAELALSEHPEKEHRQLTYEEYMKTQARAPRKGEIGITAEDVAKIETLGYVMSGSRNPMAQKRIEAMQREVHEKQASKMSLEFLAESDRRSDEKAIDSLFDML